MTRRPSRLRLVSVANDATPHHPQPFTALMAAHVARAERAGFLRGLEHARRMSTARRPIVDWSPPVTRRRTEGLVAVAVAAVIGAAVLAAAVAAVAL